MGFGSKKKGSSSGESKDKRWRKVLSVKESKEGGFYISVDDYHGDLLFQDKESGELFKLKTIGLFEPHENAPSFVKYSGSVNLNNEKQVELLGNANEE